jgi:hypothetical protein
MGSRVLPLSLAAGALLADGAGIHRLALYLVLLAIPGAAAAAFLGAGDVIIGRAAWLRGVTACLALALLVAGSAVRENAPVGGHVPAVALSSVVGAVLCYALPALVWILQPVSVRPSLRPAEARARPAAARAARADS